jgi:hypothetical protein
MTPTAPREASVSSAPAARSDLVRKIRRPIRLPERQSLWLVLGALASALVLAAFTFVTSGALARLDPDLWGENVRGYTAFGELSGVATVVLVVLALGLSVRKRVLQETRLPGRSTMMSWLSAHVVIGLLALLTATIHAGYGLLDPDLSTGAVLYWVLVIVTVAGVVWRVVYRVVPARVVPRIGNYSVETSAARAKHQATEMEKLCAGGSPELHRAKDFLLAGSRSPSEVAEAKKAISPAEVATFDRLAELSASRNRALERQALQERAVRRLQRWRVVHVPLSLLAVVLLPLHLVGAYGVLPGLLAPNIDALGAAARDLPAVTGEHPTSACADCHADIATEWNDSMHSHALTSPVMIVQTNQVAAAELDKVAFPDPKLLCVACHGPEDVRLNRKNTLPLPGGPEANHGISCTVCHRVEGKPDSGSGAFLGGFASKLVPGSTFFGPIRGAVGNAYHRSASTRLFDEDPSALCHGCHDVYLDRDRSGAIEIGRDLVLQTTSIENQRYRAQGGAGCVDCHMPVLATKRAAASADIPFDQDFAAPPREVHSHAFVGVDYLLSAPAAQDPQRAARHALLARSATLDIASADVENGVLTVRVSVANTGAGHDLPSGFAFMRQMWIELVVDGDGSRLFASGVLGRPSDDLCDAGTLSDESMAAFVTGCARPDPELVNFQRKLVDRTEVLVDPSGAPVRNELGELVPAAAAGSHEVPIQRIAGGPVARKRPFDGQVLGPLAPGEKRTLAYRVPVLGAERLTISARLLFRHLPPYILRALARGQSKSDPDLLPMIDHLEVVEMAATSKTLGR